MGFSSDSFACGMQAKVAATEHHHDPLWNAKNIGIMNYRKLQKKLTREPVCMYSDFKECAIRTEIINGETHYYLKFRDKHEFKAIYGSKLVAETLLSDPEFITLEQYERL